MGSWKKGFGDLKMEKISIEVFNFPKGAKIEDADPNEMLKIPKHVFIKIEVE